MGAVAKVEQEARALARERRLKADKERAERDERIEVLVAQVILAERERATALEAIASAERGMGSAMTGLAEEGVPMERVAELCDVAVPEVRRLRRVSVDEKPAGQQPAEGPGSASSAAAGVDGSRAAE